jgi:hypothetical protein
MLDLDMTEALLTALLLGTVQILTFSAAFLIIRRAINQKQAEIEARIEETVRQWIEPQGEGKMSRLAEILARSGEVVGQAAARTIMTNLYTDKGHAVKAANGLVDEITGAQNPLLGLLQGGKRGKGAAIAKLAELLMPMLQGKQNGGGQSPPDDVENRIGRG